MAKSKKNKGKAPEPEPEQAEAPPAPEPEPETAPEPDEERMDWDGYEYVVAPGKSLCCPKGMKGAGESVSADILCPSDHDVGLEMLKVHYHSGLIIDAS